MKLAPVVRATARRDQVKHIIVHTGQHYDAGMSDSFFEDLGIPAPDHNLGVGSATHAVQTAETMKGLEPLFLDLAPDAVLVYGDVNSTVAAALVAAKLGIPVVHVEAGLRSGDWTMPEEINRVVTDRLADLLLIPSRDAVEHLRNEGVPRERIHMVGNVMIDSLVRSLERAKDSDFPSKVFEGAEVGNFCLVTMHRPGNVDDPATLRSILDAIDHIGATMPVVFPVHPRTRAQIDRLNWTAKNTDNLRFLQPIGYIEMLSLTRLASLVVTDSGGLQEETTYLGVSCLTVRPNTERPITVVEGTNRLVEPGYDAIVAAFSEFGRQGKPERPTIDGWDGNAGERIVQVLCDDMVFPID